ncbi:MAG: hypothetical protein AAFW81_08605 [Pseudomonadota bacterium]
MSDWPLESPITILVAVAFACAATMAGASIAMRSRIFLDNPNHRSSHDHATSRAGGLAILSGFAIGLLVIGVYTGAGGGVVWPFLLLTLLAGGVGLVDDRADLPAVVKFAGQFFVALGFVWLIGPLETAPAPFIGEVETGAFGVFLTVFWLVAFMNVFNFMDGVNGIAAGAALVGLFFFALAAGLAGAGAASVIALIGAVAAAGFLPANLLRGKLFMGDCGSHALAFIIAGVGVLAANETGARASAAMMPMVFLPFILDVGFTLLHRTIRRQNILTAHREHVYQLILRRGASHGTVAAIYAGLVAFGAAGAIFMMTLHPQTHLIVVGAYAIALLAAAWRIYARAVDDGLILAGAPEERPS